MSGSSNELCQWRIVAQRPDAANFVVDGNFDGVFGKVMVWRKTCDPFRLACIYPLYIDPLPACGAAIDDAHEERGLHGVRTLDGMTGRMSSIPHRYSPPVPMMFLRLPIVVVRVAMEAARAAVRAAQLTDGKKGCVQEYRKSGSVSKAFDYDGRSCGGH